MATFSDLTGTLLDRELGSADSTVLFTSARRAQAVNEGQQQFADLTECLIRQSSVTCSNGVAEYNLLSTTVITGGDFVRIAGQGPEYRFRDSSSNLTIVAGEDFPRRDIPWLNRYEPGWRQTTTVGTPIGYYERADGGAWYLGVHPPPDIDSSEAGELLVPYVARPTDMSASTDVPFTVAGAVRTDLAEYHKALVHYAASELEKLRRDDEASDRQMQRFVAYVTRYVQSKIVKGGSHIATARRYFSQSRFGGASVPDPYRWP